MSGPGRYVRAHRLRLGTPRHHRGEMTTHYDVLGITQEAVQEDIKRAYYRKARAYHPDAHAGSADPVLHEASRAMAALNAAWNVLRDERLRAEYDDALAMATATGGVGTRLRRARSARHSPPLLIGNGFRYWLGPVGATLPDEDGRPRYNLAVDGRTDLAPLQRLAPNGLWGLHCERSPVDDRQLVNLQGMRGLQVLDLAGTRVTDAGMVHLQGLENLESLSLWDTRVGDNGLALIGRLTEIRHLGLGNCPVTDHGLASLSSLVEMRLLQLWGTEVRGPGLAHLHGLTNLERVTLPRRVGARFRRRLRRALPHVTLE